MTNEYINKNCVLKRLLPGEMAPLSIPVGRTTYLSDLIKKKPKEKLNARKNAAITKYEEKKCSTTMRSRDVTNL